MLSKGKYSLLSQEKLETASGNLEVSNSKNSGNKPPHISFLLLALSSLTLVGLLIAYLTISVDIKPATTCSLPALRQEWRSLSRLEKSDYIEAVLCLKSKRSRLQETQSLYDDFPQIHAETAATTHESAQFLSWHRYFIHNYEKALRHECDYRGPLPYWDWTLDWESPSRSPILSLDSGFGGPGTSTIPGINDAFCLTTGPFANLTVPRFRTELHEHCLSRGLLEEGPVFRSYADLLRPDAVRKLLAEQRYEDINLGLENSAHNSIPNIMGGDFLVVSAPGDPLFFLHHVQLDRLWWVWQHKNGRARQWEYNGAAEHHSTKNAALDDDLFMGGLARTVKVQDIMQTQGNLLCYTY